MAKVVSCAKLNAFSLFELLIVLAVISITTCIGIAAWVQLREQSQQAMFTARIRSALRLARAQAIERGIDVEYCGSRDRVHCDGHWSQGQLIKTAQGLVLQVYSALSANFSLTYVGNLGRNKQIVFTPQGFSAGQQGHLTLCSLKNEQCSRLYVHYSGQVVAR